MRLTRAGFPLQHALKRGVAPSKETAFAWMHIVAINACLCREKEQNKGMNTINKEKVIYIHQRHVPGEV